MNRTYIDTRHVVARYLADQLSEDELRDFEECLVTDPAIVKEVEAAARLKVGLHKLNATSELATLVTFKPWFKDTRFFALAASVAVVAIGVTLWFGRSAFESPTLVAALGTLVDGSGNPLPIASSFEIVRTRGAAPYDATIELPSTQRAIELRLLPEVEAKPARYRATLARMAEATVPVDSINGLTTDERGFVALYFDSTKLTPGNYQLTIGGDANTDAATAVSAFKIKLVPAPSAQPVP
jgi:hypothetical protein